MSGSIYVRLLGEGVEVFRPVPAEHIAGKIYLIDKDAPYDSQDETWEFLPGTRVLVEERTLSGEKELVAVSIAP